MSDFVIYDEEDLIKHGVASDLNAAADWLEANEWIQHEARSNISGKEGACALGALSIVSERSWESSHWFDNWLLMVGECEPNREYVLRPTARMNDMPGQTKDYVINLLRKAAEEAGNE